MEANEFKVQEVLNWNERFVVPLYQRQYQWHDDYDGGRTAAFWNDVAAKAGDVLAGTARFEHYMGALLLAPGGEESFGVIRSKQVVDGQQRLSTFLILIAALRETALQHGFDDLAQQTEPFLFNKLGPADTDQLVRYKLTPTPADRDVFLNILRERATDIRARYKQTVYWGGGVPKNTRYRALRAYEFFLGQVAAFLEDGPGDDVEAGEDVEGETAATDNPSNSNGIAQHHERLRSLLEALVFHLKLIVITLDENDDAQVVFETLNSAGQPLLAMDLVRNNVFHRAEIQGGSEGNARERAEQLYYEVWAPFDDGWWRETAPNARPKKPRIDHFLAHVLTAETGQRITVRELYAEYRAWATPKRQPRFQNVEDELAVLQKHVPSYEALEGKANDGSALDWLGDRLRVWQNTTVYPIALQIGSADIEENERLAICRLIDSYITRRALCDLTAKNLNRLFPRLANAIRRDGASVETVKTFFSEAKGPATRFPDDNELTRGIIEKQAYDRLPSRTLQHILWQIELALRTSKTEATARPTHLQVEHILPRTWHTHWPLKPEPEIPDGFEDPRIRVRNDALQTLGNLTIVTSSLNPAMKNDVFSKKKIALNDHSNLTLNKRIVEEDVWNEERIEERSRTLAQLACAIWPPLDCQLK